MKARRKKRLLRQKSRKRRRNKVRVIVGLGNPGLEYKTTKHNIGFMVLSQLAKENKIKLKEKRYAALIGKGKIAGEETMLVLPQTYMNRSGDTVGDLVRNEVKSIEDLIVVCDDIYLKLGRVRLKKKGSAGGHKGLESIISVLGRDDFARLRVGIATDVHKGDITKYVLTPFKRNQHKNVSHVISLAVDSLICWIEEGMDEAMNKFNIKKVATS
ncbi:MAG: aminoacyl-tRNA hydrolase [Candidatus Omnitrophota bacterium]|nr:aminoacyl-tRNA hydrolase [Candidatus Omnitrophota bacterium]